MRILSRRSETGTDKLVGRLDKNMAACHPTPAVQRMQLQDSTRMSYGAGAPNQKTLQQSTYPPHLLNWVYLAIAEQNPSQPPDQVVIRESFVKNRIYPESLPSGKVYFQIVLNL